MAYAYAQDNLCLDAEQLLTLRGDRTRFLGAQGSGEVGLGRLPNPQVDLFIRAHMDDAALARAASTSGPDAQASMRGYVAGYNRYLQDAHRRRHRARELSRQALAAADDDERYASRHRTGR